MRQVETQRTVAGRKRRFTVLVVAETNVDGRHTHVAAQDFAQHSTPYDKPLTVDGIVEAIGFCRLVGTQRWPQALYDRVGHIQHRQPSVHLSF
jgi:hypothetical protein